MKEELKFLKYRRDVVGAWPESPRKAVFLAAIESRMRALTEQPRTAEPAVVRLAPAA